jgi:hypothetical protein
MNYIELKKHIGHSLTVKEATSPDTGVVLHCRDCEDDIEHVQRPKPKLDIVREPEGGMNPRTEMDHLSVMACWHRRYHLGDVQPTDRPEEWLSENAPEGSEVLPVFMYDHGSITLSTSSFNDRWDSGQLGFIVMTPDKILEGWGRGSTEITDAMRVGARECMAEEVKLYNDYLNGEVWGFIYTGEDETENSCFGFLGSDKDNIKDAMLDHCPEARELFDEAWEKRS